MPSFPSSILEKIRPSLGNFESLYKHFHEHPELSTQEAQTASTIAGILKQSPDLEVKTDIGGHGVVAILRNGDGKTVLLRADMDALPIKEKTNLPYASQKTMEDVDGETKPVMHGEYRYQSLLARSLRLHSLWTRLPHHVTPSSCRSSASRTFLLVRHLHLPLPARRGER